MKMTREQKTVSECVKRAKERWGRGWDMLGPELQEAVVRAQVLSVVGQIASFEDTAGGRLATEGLCWSAQTSEIAEPLL